MMMPVVECRSCRFKRLVRSTVVVTVMLLAFTTSAMAQDTTDADDAGPGDPKKSYDFGILAGSLLPSKVYGVREIVPGWSASVSIPSAKGVFQFGTFVGRGRGFSYYAVDIDYRLDLMIEDLPLHFYLGFHGDQYYAPLVTRKYTGGWHFGGGVTQQIAGPFLLRADFRNRYGPGNTLEILVGLIYRWSSATN